MNDGRTTVVQSPFTIKDKEITNNWSKCYRRYRLVLKSETGEQTPLFDLNHRAMTSLFNEFSQAGFQGIGIIGNKKYVFQILNVTMDDNNYERACDYCYGQFSKHKKVVPVSLKAKELLYPLVVYACHSAVDGRLTKDGFCYATYTPYADYTKYGSTYTSGNFYTAHSHGYYIFYECTGDVNLPAGFSFHDQRGCCGYESGGPWVYNFGDIVDKLAYCRDAKALQRGLRNIQSDFLAYYIDHEYPIRKSSMCVLLKIDFADGSDYLVRFPNMACRYYSSGCLAQYMLFQRITVEGLNAVKGEKSLYVRTTKGANFETLTFNFGGKQREAFYKSKAFADLLDKLGKEYGCPKGMLDVEVGAVKI